MNRMSPLLASMSTERALRLRVMMLPLRVPAVTVSPSASVIAMSPDTVFTSRSLASDEPTMLPLTVEARSSPRRFVIRRSPLVTRRVTLAVSGSATV